ncbi:MAG: GAF domain-containing protein [Gammaproteobacteria bacterium]|nr:GAF domain-containing protein [Gammaproteobacteria bacterium]
MKKNLTVVIAENDVNAERSIARSLGVHKGWTLIHALDDADVFEAVNENAIDAVVIEALFSGRALNVIHRLQASAHSAHIPILAITGKVGPQCPELLQTGARRCLEQPVGGRAMTAVLREIAQDNCRVTHAPKRSIEDIERMSALEQSTMLDSEPEDPFDAITMLTAKLLGVPVALVSLVDKDRQFFKSQTGLPEPWASERETPLSHSFCQWVVSGQEPLVISDAREHSVLSSNQAIRDLGVIAYAGQPLKIRGEQVIGSFCAIDGHPRSWTLTELSILKDLTELTECYIELGPELSRGGKLDNQIASLGESLKLSAILSVSKGISALSRLLQRKDAAMEKSDRAELTSIVDSLNHLQASLSA